MAKTVFFTMNDFQKEGGGTIRMLGIINQLAEVNRDLVLISNIVDQSKVHENVTHIEIDFPFFPKDKRTFQLMLSVFSFSLVNNKFKDLLFKSNQVFRQFSKDDHFVFFEYLDNSIGYWLFKNKIISGYINDIHGIASNEFDFQFKKSTSLRKKLTFALKKKVSLMLDGKVFQNAKGIIFASEAMKQYFLKRYPSLEKKNNIHLPYVLNNQNIAPYDFQQVDKIKKQYDLRDHDFVFLFAGAFKETGGVQDLIQAFIRISQQKPNTKLLIIGDGPSFEECKNLVESSEFKERIILLGRQPYHLLSSFQEVAQVLVCPDRENLFSNLIVHVKYLDALVSGKVVINGNFKSVQEINASQKLSLLFTPSDIGDLANKMEYAYLNYEKCCTMFRESKSYTLNNLTYKNFIDNINFNTF